jgi:hypothetical protein
MSLLNEPIGTKDGGGITSRAPFQMCIELTRMGIE